MTALEQQILTCYQELALAPEIISEQLDIELVAVHAALAAYSPTYNKAVGEGEIKGVTDTDYNLALNVLKTLLHDDDSRVRYKAAEYLIDEKKGRHDRKEKKVNVKNITTVNLINESIRNAKRAITTDITSE